MERTISTTDTFPDAFMTGENDPFMIGEDVIVRGSVKPGSVIKARFPEGRLREIAKMNARFRRIVLKMKY